MKNGRQLFTVNRNIVLLGMPGSGKGTQAKILMEKYGIPHVSTGELLREASGSRTELGLKVCSFLNEGKLVPDGIVNEVVSERLKRKDCENGFILDGYPRTLEQARFLGRLMKSEGRPTKVLFINLDEQEVLKRLSGRRVCEKCRKEYNVFYIPPKISGICDVCGGRLMQRQDDSEETIRKRLEVYWRQTNPLIGYYKKKGLLSVVTGGGTLAEVSARLFKLIDS